MEKQWCIVGKDVEIPGRGIFYNRFSLREYIAIFKKICMAIVYFLYSWFSHTRNIVYSIE